MMTSEALDLLAPCRDLLARIETSGRGIYYQPTDEDGTSIEGVMNWKASLCCRYIKESRSRIRRSISSIKMTQLACARSASNITFARASTWAGSPCSVAHPMPRIMAAARHWTKR